MNRKHSRVFLAILGVAVLVLVGHVFAAFSVVSLGTGTPALTAADLVSTLVGEGITDVSNITFTGDNRAAARFTGEAAIVGLDSGIVLSTGQASGIVGFFPSPNPSGSTSTVLGSSPNNNGCSSGTVQGVPQFKQGLPGDTALDALVNATTTPPPSPPLRTCDATALEFDFKASKPFIFIQYVFGSEEYNEFANSTFSDVFGFFVNGVNCAFIDPADPLHSSVSVNTINGGRPLGTNAKNPALFVNNDFRSNAPRETQMDGFTVVLTCKAPVSTTGINHVKLAIADVSDATRDSNVLLRAASFTTTPPITIAKKTNGADHDHGIVPEPLANIKAGQPVKWTYDIRNSGFDKLTNVIVTDDKGLFPICPQTQLDPNQSMTCTATGTAVEGDYSNTGFVTATSDLIGPITDSERDHYFGARPAISIVTRTNETDNNVAPGPFIRVGSPVKWTYEVTNTGNVALSNVHVTDSKGVTIDCSDVPGGPQKTDLAVGVTMTCGASGVAEAGSYDGGNLIGYTNTGTATADVSVLAVDGTTFIIHPDPASDVDHYFGVEPKIQITTRTDGQNYDVVPGPNVLVGDGVAWTYVVANTGNVPLKDVTVVDDQLTGTICSIASLAIGATDTTSCARTGTAAKGQYTNVGTATGKFEHVRTDGTAAEVTVTVSNSDPDHYFGAAPEIALVKTTGTDGTNGTDNNAAPGPRILVGDPVVWTYVVKNTGNVPLAGVGVTDDKVLVGADCAVGTLDPGETRTCHAAGTAQRDQYTNTGTAIGTVTVYTANGQTKVVTTAPASDVDHYFGVDPRIGIVTKTNGTDNNTTAKFIQVGSPVKWSYEVTATGNVDLHDVTVTDNQGAAVSCPKTVLAVQETMLCSANGVAAAGSFQNIGTATGKADVQTTGGNRTVTKTAEDHDRYFGADPRITILTKTDGSDNNSTQGPSVLVDDPVAWSYIVKNVGNVDLSDITVVDDKLPGTVCTIPSLKTGVTDSTTCKTSVKAVKGPHTNVGTASGKFGPVEVSGTDETTTVTTDPASDPDHYFGAAPEIAIVKKTGTSAANATDNPAEPGPRILVGDPVTWTFDVTNKGNVPLIEVVVTDDQVGSVCSIATLAVGETRQCSNPTAATAQRGQHVNTGTAAGKAEVVTVDGLVVTAPVTHSDVDHYFGVDPKLAIVKKTGTTSANATDNKAARGPVILAGDQVVWTFAVTNTGNVPLTGVTVTDDRIAVGPDCAIGALNVDETRTCSVSGTAQRDQHHNTATATGQAEVLTVDGPRTVVKTATDDDFYFGAAPEIKVVKMTGTDSTNGTDNNAIPGPVILAGDPVVWTYVVKNTGNVPLTGVAVTDDKVVVGADCAVGALDPGETRTCHAAGTAQRDQHQNTATATGQADVLTVDGLKSVVKTATDVDYYFGAAPELKVVKKTGPSALTATDNPGATGPVFLVGDEVVWTYTVTNTGNVSLSDVSVTDDRVIVGPDCRMGTIPAGESRTCAAAGPALRDQHENIATATGKADVLTVTGLRSVVKSATDNDHYFGAAPEIKVVKKTNGTDNDTAPGVFVLVDDIDTWSRWNGDVREPLSCRHREEHSRHPMTWSTAHKKEHDSEPSIWTYKKEHEKEIVTWTYTVTNSGNVPLRDVTVTDDKVGPICTIGSLAVGASTTCTSSARAVKGQYENTGIATGKADVVTVTGSRVVTVTDRNVDHYFGADPKISLVKLTNGSDNNYGHGPTLLVGAPVTWTYIVTNTGNAPLANVVVTDDKAGPICTIPLLAAGARESCSKTATVVRGWYKNVGMATAKLDTVTASGQVKTVTVTDTDVDQYFGALPAIAIVKKTNGTNNNSAPGPSIKVGQTVTWTYTVVNIGNVPLTNVAVRDSRGERVSCPGSMPSPYDDGKTFDKDDSWKKADWTFSTNDEDDDDRWQDDDHRKDDEYDKDQKRDYDGHFGSNELPVGAILTCSASGKAIEGQYMNIGTVTATAPVGPPVSASDVEYYFGVKNHKSYGDDDRENKGKDKRYDRD